LNDPRGPRVAGLVLAAGGGARFGERPKLLADLGGRPVLEHAIGAQCAVEEIARIVVVLGAHAEELMASVNFMRAEPFLCEQWREGMASSLRCGVGALAGAERVIVTLGDQPLLSSEVVAKFVNAAPGTRAIYEGRPGHPVVLGPEQLGAVRELRGDRGARELLGDGQAIECGRLGWHRDVDTPRDLEAIRDEVRAVL
jgi:CTP:molybdopterin cytidylyltransferase MocA